MNSVKDRTRAQAADIAHLSAQIEKLQEQVAALIAAAAAEREAAASFSIKVFCKRNGLSESQYFKLQREGRGPRTMRTGSVGVRISVESERAWISEREAEAADSVTTSIRNIESAAAAPKSLRPPAGSG
jgi:hypothetical protein